MKRFLAYWRATGVIPRWELAAAYLLIVGAVGIGFNEFQQRDDQFAQLAVSNRALAARAGDLAHSIQDQRVDAIRSACRDQNRRHRAAVRKTNQLLARPAVPPTRVITAAQRRAQERAIREWVSTLVPAQNCAERVKELTK